jgi:hypothetical protein
LSIFVYEFEKASSTLHEVEIEIDKLINIKAVIDLAKSKLISQTSWAKYKYPPVSSLNQGKTHFDFAKLITA